MLSMERIFVAAGITLLSVITLIYGTSSSEHITVNLNNEAIITGTAIGQSLLDEIQSRSFDENTKTTFADDITDLTNSASLGPESGESIFTQFDDIDDFNGYSRSQALARLDSFTVNVEVYYVSVNNPETKQSSRSFAKKIDVEIVNKYLANRLILSKIVGY